MEYSAFRIYRNVDTASLLSFTYLSDISEIKDVNVQQAELWIKLG